MNAADAVWAVVDPKAHADPKRLHEAYGWLRKNDPVAARLARLPVTKYKILAFMLCGTLAAIAGILDFSFIQTVQPNSGLSFTFPVFAAVIIGGASLAGGKGTVIGTMAGALLLAELQQGLALLSPGPHVQQLFLGAVTIGAVALDLGLTKIRASRAT